MAVLTIWVSDEKEKQEVEQLINTAKAYWVLKYQSNVREIDIIKEGLKLLIEKLQQ